MGIYSNTMLGMRAAPQGSSIGGLRARRVLSLLHPLNRSQQQGQRTLLITQRLVNSAKL